MNKKSRARVIFGISFLAITTSIVLGVGGMLIFNRWWISTWGLSHPVPQSLVTHQVLDELNYVYQVKIPKGTPVVAVNLLNGKDQAICSHYQIPESQWALIQDALPTEYLLVAPENYNNICQLFAPAGWSGVDPADIESAYQQQGLPFRTVIQSYPIDGECSVYFYAGDEAFSQAFWALDWGI